MDCAGLANHGQRKTRPEPGFSSSRHAARSGAGVGTFAHQRIRFQLDRMVVAGVQAMFVAGRQVAALARVQEVHDQAEDRPDAEELDGRVPAQAEEQQQAAAHGERTGRARPGSVLRSTITPIATAANANSVPALEMSARMSTGNSAAKNATKMQVIPYGVLYFGCTTASFSGSRPSRAIVNRMRVWPNIIISTTDGRARIAA